MLGGVDRHSCLEGHNGVLALYMNMNGLTVRLLALIVSYFSKCFPMIGVDIVWPLVDAYRVETILVPLATPKRQKFDSFIDGRSGCYAVYSPRWECLYVGRAKNLLSRIESHFVKVGGRKRWCLSGVSSIAEPFAPHLSMLKVWVHDDPHGTERRLMRILKPRFNKAKATPQIQPILP